MKQPQVSRIGSDLLGWILKGRNRIWPKISAQKELRLGRFPLLYRIMTVFSHPRG
jgi:hypothetical protein